jgi:hypothetical protein
MSHWASCTSFPVLEVSRLLQLLCGRQRSNSAVGSSLTSSLYLRPVRSLHRATLEAMQLLRKLVHTVRDKRYRRWLAIGILLLTFILFVRFFVTHPEYLERLRRVSPTTIIIVLLLYIPATLSLVWSSSAIVRLCGGHIGRKENVLLTAYSSIINFFGLLQSGPGVRAIYLKTRHGIRMRDFMLAMLIYYALYASFSELMFLIGVRPWWQTILGLLAVVGFSALVIRRFARLSHGGTTTTGGSSNNTSTATPTSPATLGSTITDSGISCTLISAKVMNGDQILKPDAGNECVLVTIKLVNQSGSAYHYNPYDFTSYAVASHRWRTILRSRSGLAA